MAILQKEICCRLPARQYPADKSPWRLIHGVDVANLSRSYYTEFMKNFKEQPIYELPEDEPEGYSGYVSLVAIEHALAKTDDEAVF